MRRTWIRKKAASGYADVVRSAMIRRRLTVRDLSRATGVSYEHIRRIVSGLPVMSAVLNVKLAKELGLDPEEMWEHATADKLQMQNIGPSWAPSVVVDARFPRIWQALNDAERERLMRIADGWLAARWDRPSHPVQAESSM